MGGQPPVSDRLTPRINQSGLHLFLDPSLWTVRKIQACCLVMAVLENCDNNICRSLRAQIHNFIKVTVYMFCTNGDLLILPSSLLDFIPRSHAGLSSFSDLFFYSPWISSCTSIQPLVCLAGKHDRIIDFKLLALL